MTPAAGSWRRLRLLLLALILLPLWAGAGGGPETTLLVVNADSPDSLKVAETYRRLREIPDNHVLLLHDIPTQGRIEMALFRDRIWTPIRRFLDQQGLEGRIDLIVYSAGFPYAVDIMREFRSRRLKYNRHVGKSASLTGLTFFGRLVEAGDLSYLSRDANRYFRRPLADDRRAARKPLSPEDERRFDAAQKALKERDYETASAIARDLSQRYPGRKGIWLTLAQGTAELDLREEALDSLRRLADLGYDNGLRLRNDRHLKRLWKDPSFVGIVRRIESPKTRFDPPQGFRSRYRWDRQRLLADRQSLLHRYYLSAMLGYTGARGNSVEEIERYLRRAAASDGRQPDGGVYLMENGNIRTEVRQPLFGETCDLLRAIGHRCEILSRGHGSRDGRLPDKRRDIIGLATGTPSFDWAASGSRLLPGAFADSYTSWGGDFDNPNQTKLSAFLRAGAAGSSGAVTEPYSFPEKFPSPLLHYYYGLGYSLAEAWYQSVASPYQALLVGDPLARPYAELLPPQLLAPDPEPPWRGVVELRVGDRPAGQPRIGRLELWIDGRPVAEAAAGKPLRWDTRQVTDGAHELRLVAIEAGPLETRSYRRYRIHVDNGGSPSS